MLSVDLNCDLGEGTGADDLALLEIVTSANIACGGHAGDEQTMAATVRAALARGVAIGAHPGYPDRAGFGRTALDVRAAEVEGFVFEQVAALARIAAEQGAALTHVKLHGALYHKAMGDAAVALAVAAAVRRLDAHRAPHAPPSPALRLVAMPGTTAHRVWREEGLGVLIEAFADRRYEPDGTLTARTHRRALITLPPLAAAQAYLFTCRGIHGIGRGMRPHTICIHSDTPGAVAVAKEVRAMLERSHVRVASPSATPTTRSPSKPGF